MSVNLNSQKLQGEISLGDLIIPSIEVSITTTEPKADPTLLKEIHACFNFVTNISDTTQVYVNLTVLSLVCNNLTEIPHLQFCPNLIELNLNNNSISELKHLNYTPKLATLSISSNHIVKLHNLFELSSLQKLVLSGNRITSIDLTSIPDSLPRLTHLGLLDNKLASLQDVEKFLVILPNLSQLSIGLNPLTEYNMISTHYLLTNLKIPRVAIFTQFDFEKEDLNESDRILRIRQRVLNLCTKLVYLDLSPISSA